MPKYNEAQREKIRGIVFESCLLAYRATEIVRILAENQYHIERRMVEKYMAEAMVEIKAAGRIDREKMRGESVSRLMRLYRSAVGKTERDKRLALAIQRELDVIGGLVVQQNLNPAAKSFEDWLKSESAAGDSGTGSAGGGGGSALPAPPTPRVPDSLDDPDEIKEDDLHDPLAGDPFAGGPDKVQEGSAAGDQADGDGGGG